MSDVTNTGGKCKILAKIMYSSLNRSEAKVLYVLVDGSTLRGYAFATNPAIGVLAGIPTKSVEGAISSLLKRDFIYRVKGYSVKDKSKPSRGKHTFIKWDVLNAFLGTQYQPITSIKPKTRKEKVEAKVEVMLDRVTNPGAVELAEKDYLEFKKVVGESESMSADAFMLEQSHNMDLFISLPQAKRRELIEGVNVNDGRNTPTHNPVRFMQTFFIREDETPEIDTTNYI